MQAAVGHLLGPDEGEVVHLLALGVRFMIAGETTGGAFSLVEHPLPPRALGAPLHTHRREDEYSYVLEGRVGLQLGAEELEAGPGDLVFKPRHVPHTFWNAGDEPARLLELISPAGFEHYFNELAPLLAAPERDQAAIGGSSPATSSRSTSSPSPPWPSGTTCDWDSHPADRHVAAPVVALRDVARYASGPLVRAIGQPRLRWRLDTSSSEQVAGWSGGFGRLPWGPTGSLSGLSSTAA